MATNDQLDTFEPAPHIATPPPGPHAKEVLSRDQAVISPCNVRVNPLVAKKALGAVIEDVDGNRFLDFAAGIAVCSTGHCHPKVVKAIQQQAAELVHTCGTIFYYPIMVELAEKISGIMPWRDQCGSRVFFTNSGTETIEAALKLARLHTGRKHLIAFRGAFHGRSMGGLSLTASKVTQKRGFGPLVPMVWHGEFGDVTSLTKNLFKHHMAPDEVAAIFFEPIQGEGGYRIPPADFLPELRALCDEHGILLVADEIQTGAGRTGKWWACEHDGVVPDMICSAKGLASGMPLGALITKEHIMDWPMGAHGTTYGGNPVCCASALATLALIESEYMNNAATLGPVAMAQLVELAHKHGYIANVRGRGLLIAVDAVEGKDSKKYSAEVRGKIVRESFNRGLLILPCGEHAIRLIPPLCITEAQLNTGLDVLEDVLKTFS